MVKRIPAAIGIAGVICLAHATNQNRQATTVSNSRRISQEKEIPPWHESRRQAIVQNPDFSVACQRRAANIRQGRQGKHMVIAQLFRPIRKGGAYLCQHIQPAIQFNAVRLPIIKSDSLHMAIGRQRMRQTYRGILPTRKQYQCSSRICHASLLTVKCGRSITLDIFANFLNFLYEAFHKRKGKK